MSRGVPFNGVLMDPVTGAVLDDGPECFERQPPSRCLCGARISWDWTRQEWVGAHTASCENATEGKAS